MSTLRLSKTFGQQGPLASVHLRTGLWPLETRIGYFSFVSIQSSPQGFARAVWGMDMLAWPWLLCWHVHFRNSLMTHCQLNGLWPQHSSNNKRLVKPGTHMSEIVENTKASAVAVRRFGMSHVFKNSPSAAEGLQ